MKPPRAPKPLDALLAEHGDRLLDVLDEGFRPTVAGRYLHWDRLRRLDPPEGFSHEEWWLGVKLSRRGQSRPIPLLRDTGGRPFSFMLPDRVQEALHRIDSQLRGRIGIAERVTNPDARDRFIVDSLIEEAITSSQLEGASTTRAAAKDMLRAGRRPRDRSERMIFNNYRAMQAVREIGEAPLSLAEVLRLHATLTSDTLDDPAAAGRIQRPGDERVRVVDHRDQRVLHTPPPAEELPDRLGGMIRFANQGSGGGDGFLHPVVRAVVLHFWLAYEHPFEDGNGRTARALFYWSMLHHDYWLFEFISISRRLVEAPARYARAFLHTRDRRERSHLLHRAPDRDHPAGARRARRLRRAEGRAGPGSRSDPETRDRPEPPPARLPRPRRPASGRRLHHPGTSDEPRRRLRHRPRGPPPTRGAGAPGPAPDREEDQRIPPAAGPRRPHPLPPRRRLNAGRLDPR